jgi:mRNA-degrading endonuclease toxin of MazEF toxin-antitoxin module
MSIISDAFQRIGIGKVKVIAGGIYKLEDGAIKIPDGDLKGDRTKHDFRTVVVLSNQTICNSVACPVVTIIPLSSKTDSKAETDIVIRKTEENSLAHDSRLMLGYVQPVLKSDLEEKFGTLSEAEWEEVMGQIVWNFDR